MQSNSTPHRLSPLALAALSVLLVACADKTKTEASATRAPGSEGAVSAQVNNDGDATATPVMIGWLTVPGSADGSESEPTTIAYEVDPLLTSDCDIPKKTVYFDHDSDEVSDAAEIAISQVALCLEQSPLDDDYVEIIGHADKTGPEEYNRELGLDRANSVADALVSEGISKDRIATYSWGEYKADEPRDWDDRRVVIRLAQ